jgi:hypothetical protein
MLQMPEILCRGRHLTAEMGRLALRKYACDCCKRIFLYEFELREHERVSGHSGILEISIDQSED